LLLFIDNFDSFVHNLARYFRQLECQTQVVRNNAITVAEIRRLKPQAIVLSPGPCTPNEAGCSLDVIRHLADEFPILGVCLGHQTLGAVYGAKIVRAAEPMHGRTSEINHNGTGLFESLPHPLTVCRYHSLIVEAESLPSELRVTAQTTDGTIMALEHVKLPLFGVQFHPEAVLTVGGYRLLANFLRIAGISVADSVIPSHNAPWPVMPVMTSDWKDLPLTF
jgi:anthranilate synthase component II